MLVKAITFLDNRKMVVESYKLTSLPIREQIIIGKSIEFFSDPEPCFIHRSAVMKRLLTEIDDYLYDISKEGVYEIKWSDFNKKFKEVLELRVEIDCIRFII